MARVAINTGASANDGTGDNLRSAGGILNNNFLELYTYLGAGSTTVLSAPLWSSTNAGINTLSKVGIGTTNPRFALEVGAVGASGTTLFVNGDARVTGIVTIGPASITLNGITNTVNIGTGITLNGSTGIISATAIILGGTTLTGAAVTFITAGSGISVDQGTGNVTITATGGGGSSQFVTTAAGIHTLSNVGIGTTNPTSKLTVSGNVSIVGVATITGDARINYLTIGRGGNDIFDNTALGTYALLNNSIATPGNTAVGYGVLTVNTTGTNNTGLGDLALGSNILGSNNTANGYYALYNATGSSNVAVGASAGITITTGSKNTLLGAYTGNQNGLDIRTSNNNVVLSDGDGNIRFYANSSGNVGLGTTNPTSKLTVSGDVLVSDKIVAGLTSSIIPFYWENFSDLPSFSTYHGAFAHVHQTGKAYYAHTRWIELVHTEASGVVGTGTERYNVGIVTASTLNVGTSGTIITTTTAGLVGIGTTNPTSKLTVSGNVNIVGVATATSFSGSGSGLTNIPSGQLSGALPAIDGSALIGVVGSGSGVIIKDDGSSVGTAGTIDFGANLSVSFSSGIATITATGGGGSSQFVTTAAGIHTLSNVGIGTTNPISKLQIERFGIQSGFGTFLASAGITTDIDIFTISSTNFKTLEYTLHFTNESNIQAQKVLIMQNGTTSYSQEYAIMFEPNQIVSIGTTISSGICKLQVTPETGISGITTYRFSKETLL